MPFNTNYYTKIVTELHGLHILLELKYKGVFTDHIIGKREINQSKLTKLSNSNEELGFSLQCCVY